MIQKLTNLLWSVLFSLQPRNPTLNWTAQAQSPIISWDRRSSSMASCFWTQLCSELICLAVKTEAGWGWNETDVESIPVPTKVRDHVQPNFFGNRSWPRSKEWSRRCSRNFRLHEFDRGHYLRVWVGSTLLAQEIPSVSQCSLYSQLGFALSCPRSMWQRMAFTNLFAEETVFGISLTLSLWPCTFPSERNENQTKNAGLFHASTKGFMAFSQGQHLRPV